MQSQKENAAGMPESASLRGENRLVRDFREHAAQAAARGDWETAAKTYAQGLEQRSVELALINSVQEGLSTRSEMQAIYDLVGDKLRDTFNAQVVMISQYDPGTDRITHHYAIERGQHLQIPGWLPIDVSRAKIVRTKRPVMINQDEIIALLEAQSMKVVPGTKVPKTWLGVPMLVGGETCGIVSLQNLDIENAFSTSDIELLTALTNSMSQSLENARLFNETQRLLDQMEREMGLARQAQKSILPLNLPTHLGYDFGSAIIPAQAVGGDFYDFIPVDDQRLCMVIGDVSAKGLPAALFMAVTFSHVRAETGRGENQTQILENLNRFLLRMNAEMFVTLLYCLLDFETGRVTYSRAGHVPPVVLEPNGVFSEIPMRESLPLGLFKAVHLDQGEFNLPAGGLFLLSSDGLHEATNSEGDMLGLERVRQELLAHRQGSAALICQKLWEVVQDHSGRVLHQDDFTAVVVKRKEQG